MDLKQKEALINNIVGALDAIIRDSVELHNARHKSNDPEVVQEMEERVSEGKKLLRVSMEQLLL